MSSSNKTKNYVGLRSGNRCAFEDCRVVLTDSSSTFGENCIIGELAHMYGEKPGSARYSDKIDSSFLNSDENLIYLCPNCHTKIDKQENSYPFEFLKEVKKRHEEFVLITLDNAMSELTFAELEITSKAIASGKHCVGDGFYLISPEEKIKKNNLTDVVRALISMGLSRSYEVENYLLRQAQLDEEFPERLKNGFKNKYSDLKQNINGDPLFYEMLKFAQNGSKEPVRQAAGLAIISHLFELCEVFEK